MTRRHAIPAPQEPIRQAPSVNVTAPRDLVIVALLVAIFVVLLSAAGVRP